MSNVKKIFETFYLELKCKILTGKKKLYTFKMFFPKSWRKRWDMRDARCSAKILDPIYERCGPLPIASNQSPAFTF